MKYCSQCEAEMDDDEAICPKCGYRPPTPVEQLPGIVPLDDALWADLKTAYGDGVEVARWLRRVVSQPGADTWSALDVWRHLVHQNTVYSASFAAVPHLVAAVAALAPETRTRHEVLILVGAVAGDGIFPMTRSTEGKPGYMAAYVTAINDAAGLITESLLARPEESQARMLLASLAAIAGFDGVWHELMQSV